MKTSAQQKQLAEDLLRIARPLQDHIAIYAEGTDGFRLALHASTPILSASLIKLPILLYVHEQTRADPGMLQKMITLEEDEVVGGSGVLQLLSGRQWSVRDLLALMIAVSDNTATNLLIDAFGRDNIQQWIREHGFSQTVLGRRLMDTAAAAAGRENLISARDACRAICRIFCDENDFPEAIKSWFLHQQFRDKLPGLIDEMPHPVSVYNKTGEMEKIDHDAAYFTYRSEGICVAVLTAGVKDRRQSLSAMQTIGKRLADYLIT